MSATQHQWQENVVRAEKYIYDESDTITNLIVGSSLAQRIKIDSLPQFYNLAFAGQSLFDGLEIVRHKKKLPKNIFIEINLIFKEQNKEFSAGFFQPLTYNIKKYCISFRSDKQPLFFIYPAIQKTISKGNEKKKVKSLEADIKENEIFNSMMKLQISNYSKIPDSNFVSGQFLLLADLVKDLKNKGVNIIFFEMPLNPNLVELPLAKFIRNKTYDFFPQNINNYIKIPNCSNYITGDGLHLKYQEALIYTSYFKEEAKRFNP
jgi:hypothetical protein